MTSLTDAPTRDSLDFDLIDVEVHQKSIRNIAKEMAITLMRTSGSPVVTDAKDFSTCILDPDGDQLAFSGYVSFHVSTSVFGVQAVLKRYPRERLRPGDAFMCNDPHSSGAVHQGDVGILMPYFYEGEHIGWGYVNEHVLDIGGSAISGFAPGALDSYSESLAFPGIRVAQNGRIDSEWESFIANNVRLAGPVMNDIRSMIAACNAGQRRLDTVLDEIGLDRFVQLNEAGKDLSEKGFRAIISSLPDGTYDSMDWVEYDARGPQELHEMQGRVVIDGDEMTIQFRGDPQTPSFINGAKPSVIGQSWSTMLAMLAYDIPVNAGLWRPVHFDLGPEGSIVNSVAPAPVTMSHIQTGMRVNRVLTDIFSQACSLSDNPAVISRLAGQPGQNQTYFTGFGIDRRNGKPVVCFSMGVGMPAGGPAQTTSDGLESYGATAMAGCDLPDVESEELSQPGIILWRKVAADTGGAGASRGGLGVNTAISLLHCEYMNAGAYSNTSYVPPRGAAGGLPGSTGFWHQMTDNNVEASLEGGTFPGEEEITGTVLDSAAQNASVYFRTGDIYKVIHGGGGGVGDPLLRAGERVAADVRDGYVSREMAAQIYGVVLDDALAVDHEATTGRRSAIRSERIGHTPERELREGAPVFQPLGVVDGNWTCRMCDQALTTVGTNWREGAVSITTEASKYHADRRMFVREHTDGEDVVVVENYCPGCASALAVDVSLAGYDAPQESRPDVLEPFLVG